MISALSRVVAGRSAARRARRAGAAAVPADRLPGLLGELAGAGLPVAVLAAGDVDPTELLGLLLPGAQLCVPLRHVAAATELARAAARREVTVLLRAPAWTAARRTVLAEVRTRVPGTGVQLDARLPGTEEVCREASGPVQLITAALPLLGTDHLPAADAELAAVRCLDVLLAGPATVSVDAADPDLARLAVQRAAWHRPPSSAARHPDSWELLVPHQVLVPPTRTGLPPAAPVRALIPVVGGNR